MLVLGIHRDYFKFIDRIVKEKKTGNVPLVFENLINDFLGVKKR